MNINDMLSKLKITREFLGISALSQFSQFNSSPRGEMLSRQLTQALVLNNGEVRLLLSGLEVEYGRTVFNTTLENECQIYTLLPKYDMDNIVEIVVVYQDLVTGRFDFRVIPKFKKHHPKFGFKVKWTDGLLDLTQGDILPAGTILASSVGVSDEGYLKYGQTLNVALTSHLETAEDAFIMNRTAIENMSFTMESEYSMSLTADDIPINMYGTIDNPRILPLKGEKVPDSGYIFGSRKFDKDKILLKFTKKALMNYDPMFDQCIAVRTPNGVVSDVSVTYNSQSHKKAIFPELETQLFNYVRLQEGYENSLIRTADDIVKDYGYKVKFDNEFHTEVVRLKMINHPNVRAIKKKSRLAPFTIKIKVLHTVYPNKAYKLSGLNGDKGIISDIWEPERMPCDSEGNIADALMFYGSTIGRMNVGRLYEQYITAAVVKVGRLVKENYKSWGWETSFDFILNFLKIIDTQQYTDFKDMNNSTRRDVIKEIVKTNFHVYLPVDNDKVMQVITLEIANNENYRPTKGPVRFVNQGKEVITKDSILIGPMYLVLLNKIGDTWLSVASPKLNHFGIPTAPPSSSSKNLTWSPNPVRTGNTEFRLYSAYAPPELIVNIKERANSLAVQSNVCRNLLNADNPVDIDDISPRSEIEYGTDAIMHIIDSVHATFGVKLEYIKEV